MNFYTNILQRGNNLHVRAVVNGERQNFKIRYQPTLFSPVDQETGYKTLEGKPVLPRHFEYIKENSLKNEINAEFWLVKDANHVDGMLKYPDEYANRMEVFFNSNLN